MVFKNALRNYLMGISCLDSSLTEDFLNDTSHSEIAAPNRAPVQEASSHNTSLIAASLQLLFVAGLYLKLLLRKLIISNENFHKYLQTTY